MRTNIMTGLTALALAAGCAGTPGPGDPGYAYNVDGTYVGRLTVEGEPFEATLDLSTGRGGAVRGSFAVRAPLEIEGSVEGAVVDDLLRVTLSYDAGRRPPSQPPCESRIEGILTVARGGGVLDGPVTITDCGDPLAGGMRFRRALD